MQVESIAAYVAAIGGCLRLVVGFDQAGTTFVDCTGALTACASRPSSGASAYSSFRAAVTLRREEFLRRRESADATEGICAVRSLP
jgi:hypothetical protein